MIKLMTLIHVSKALLGCAIERKGLGPSDVGGEKYNWRCQCLIPGVKGVTGRQKKASVLEMEMQLEFLKILLVILVALK